MNVTLTGDEVRRAVDCGTARQVHSVAHGSRQGYGLTDPYARALWKHVNGAGGELAAARALGTYWPGHVGVYHRVPDLPPDWEVRTLNGGPDLIVRPDDPDVRDYVLVNGTLPDYCVVGWIRGNDAKRPEWLSDLGNGRPRVYQVPRRVLVPIDEDAAVGA